MVGREVRSWKSKCVLEISAAFRARRDRSWASLVETSEAGNVRRALRINW